MKSALCFLSWFLFRWAAPIILHLTANNKSICSESCRLSESKTPAIQTSLSIPPATLTRVPAGGNKREVTSPVNPPLLGHMIPTAALSPSQQLATSPLLSKCLRGKRMCGPAEFFFWINKYLKDGGCKSAIKAATRCSLTISIHLQINCFLADWISHVRFW